MSIVLNDQTVNYQVSEEEEEVVDVSTFSPYASIPTDKLVLQLGAADLQSILEDLVEARVEARLAKKQSSIKLEPFGSVMSINEGVGQQQETPEASVAAMAAAATATKPVTAAHVNNVAQKFDTVDLKPLENIKLTDILSDDDEEEDVDAAPLTNHDELTRCFECQRKHMTPNGLFMHLTQMHPKCEQVKRLKSTTWCPMCIVNCRHWYNMAMHVSEIHGQRSWWLESGEDKDVQVRMVDDVMRPETPKPSRGRVRQVSMVEYTDVDNDLDYLNVLRDNQETTFFSSPTQEQQDVKDEQKQILRKSSFGGFFQDAIEEKSAELWDDEMKSLDDRMQEIMNSNDSE
eukprot:TRINITY_DN3802_c0_g1_i1.p1 TRINITY_DN3802_c0_g1~~TRINITY_DN3802_c0_g1_i1.p1  ORF type:complete len:345 (+),score=66.53 TRINITY_DN3802_c0_g1_i1:356-1390(+)